MDNLVSLILGFVLVETYFFVCVVMDLAMEGNELAYPYYDYMVPSLVFSLILLLVTIVAKKKKKSHFLKRVGVCFFLVAMIHTVVLFPYVPTVCSQIPASYAFGRAFAL